MIVEVTAAAVAIGGIVIARAQSGTVDLYASTAPVLVAVPAVIVTLRLYQVLLRGLARASAQRRGVIGFLGLTRAAQGPVTLALPAMTLVLALTVAALLSPTNPPTAPRATRVSKDSPLTAVG